MLQTPAGDLLLYATKHLSQTLQDSFHFGKNSPLIRRQAPSLFLDTRQQLVACPITRACSTPTLPQQSPPYASFVHEPCAPWPPASSTQLVRSATTPPVCNTERIVLMLSRSDLFGRPPRLVADLIASQSRRLSDVFTSHYVGPIAPSGQSLPMCSPSDGPVLLPEVSDSTDRIRDHRHAPPCAYRRTFPGGCRT